MAKKKLTMADLMQASVDAMGNMIGKSKYERVSTGSPFLDRVLGGSVIDGGVPRGGVVEISGENSSGKTTTALTICRKILNLASPEEGIAYMDYEHAVDRVYAKRGFGMDLDNTDPRIIYAQPITIGHLRNLLAKYFKLAQEFGNCPLRAVVIDSVAAMNPDAFLDKAMEGEKGKQIGLQARELSQFFSEFVGLLEKWNVTLVLCNQVRSNIKLSQYEAGPEEDTMGGRAIKFYSWIRVTLKPKGFITSKAWDPVSGEENADRNLFRIVEVATIKNKTAPPYLKDILHIRYGSGFDTALTTVLKGTKYGLLHPDAKNSIADRERTKQLYITGDGKTGFSLWKYEKDSNDPFVVAVEEKKNSTGRRIVKKTEICKAKTLVSLADALRAPQNKEAWNYLLKEVLRHYKRDEQLFMTPDERATAHSLVADSTEEVQNAQTESMDLPESESENIPTESPDEGEEPDFEPQAGFNRDELFPEDGKN